MQTVYMWDRQTRVYTGIITIDDFTPIPNTGTLEPVPEHGPSLTVLRSLNLEEWVGATQSTTDPNGDCRFIDGQWMKVKFSKKEFLLLCGLPQIATLGEVKKTNPIVEAVYTLLMAAEYIDVTDTDTIEMVNLLATDAGGNVLTKEQASAVLAGIKIS